MFSVYKCVPYAGLIQQQWLEDGIGHQRSKGCEVPWVLEPKSGPLQEQQVPLTTEPSLQALIAALDCSVYTVSSGPLSCWLLQCSWQKFSLLSISPQPCLSRTSSRIVLAVVFPQRISLIQRFTSHTFLSLHVCRNTQQYGAVRHKVTISKSLSS